MLATLLLPAGASAGVFNTIWVGPNADPMCDYDTLPEALAEAAFTVGGMADEIRLTQNLSNVSQELINWNPATSGALSIVGGWDSCGGMQVVPQTPTVLTGDGTGPVLAVSAAPGNFSEVAFFNVHITGAGIHRGVTVDGTGASLDLISSEVRNNAGGLAVTNGADLALAFTTISMNDSGASPGGGVICSGAGSRVLALATIELNTTNSAGGGIYLDTGCQVALYNGARVQFNEAQWGGGVAVSTATSVLHRDLSGGVLSEGTFINGNLAHIQGGGVWAVNGAQAYLDEVQLNNNFAGERGAGIYADGNALVTMDRSIRDCFRAPRCSSLSGNSITTNVRHGIAAYAAGGADIILTQTFIENNDAIDDTGFALMATGTGSQIVLESISYSNNTTVSLFEARDGAEIIAAFVSAAGNGYAWLRGTGPSASEGAHAEGGASVEIFSSALDDHSEFTNKGGTIKLDCVVAETLSGASDIERSVAQDPLFVNASNNDLRLLAGSPAIDYCDESSYVPTQLDLFHRMRAADDPNHPNNFGTYDLGGYEFDGIFFDGFESGNTGAWSSTAP